MKSKSRKTFLFPLVIFTLIATQISATASSGAALGKTFKAAGRTTSAIPTMLLSGSGTPSASVGINGDFYIDTKTFNLFGPKANGKWPVPINLKGPTGLMGPQGVDGKTGSTGSVSVGSAGDTGAQGETGATGATGEKGDKGETGATGATGERGATGASGGSGATGAQGPTGAQGGSGATGSIGATGATGSAGTAGVNGTNGTNGSIGATGAQGAQGLKGDTGTVGSTGSAGPSNAYYISVGAFTLNSSAWPSSAGSPSIGTLEANKNYVFDVILKGKIANSVTSKYFGLTSSCSSGLATLNANYVVSESFDVISELASHSYVFHVIGTVAMGNSAGSLAFTIIDLQGVSGANAMVFSGSAVIQLVGSIG